MKLVICLKIIALSLFSVIGFVGFLWMQTGITAEMNANKTKIVSENKEIRGYKNWTKVNDEPQIMISAVAKLCGRPSKKQLEDDIHNNKYINVFVNDIGKDEMLTKKNPNFPEGTVIVKQKLTTLESKMPELLTVMIKREKGFNPKIGDWEFLTFNGAGSEITARGKLESCQKCHLPMKETDYISRNYLPKEVQQKLK